MKRLLIVTTLDYRYYDNNRVHHLVKQLQKRIEKVFLMYKKAYIQDKSSHVNQLQGFLTLKTKCFRDKNVTGIEVDPIFNHIGSLGLSILKLSNPYIVPGSYPKKFLRKFMSCLGFVTELGLLPSFLIAYLTHIREKTDIFIGQGPWEVAFGLFLRRLGFVRMVVYDDFDYAPGNQPISKIRRRIIAHIEKACLKKSDLIVSVGDLLGKLREEQSGQKVTVIQNGVNLRLFQPAQKKVPHPPSLIYVGFVYGWSGLELIFSALQRVKKQFPTIRFLIIGHTISSYIEELMSLRDKMKLGEHVFYLGKKSYGEIVPYLREADIGMAVFRPIGLRKYAFSLKVIEYMAAGLPIITTQGTQSASVIQAHQCGEAVEFEAESLAQCICSLLSDKKKFARYEENSKKESLNYDWTQLIYYQYFEAMKACYAKVSQTRS